MPTTDEVRRNLAATGAWLTDPYQDTISQGVNLIALVTHSHTDLDILAYLDTLKATCGIVGAFIGKFPDAPNVYPLVIRKYGQGVTTLSCLESDAFQSMGLPAASLVAVSTQEAALAPQQAQAFVEAAKELGNPSDPAMVPVEVPFDQAMYRNQWVMFRVLFTGRPAPACGELAAAIEKSLGMRALALNEGLAGVLVSDDDWRGKDWTMVLINPDNTTITPAEVCEGLADAYGDWAYTCLSFTNQALIDNQGWAETAYSTRLVTDAGGDLIHGAAGLAGLLGDIGSKAKYLGWAALGLGAIYVLYKGVTLIHKDWKHG